MSLRNWSGVPSEKVPLWRQIFSSSREGWRVRGGCPICGAEKLYRYYQVGAPAQYVSKDERFVARGACWEWCGVCWTYEHYTALVPDWWKGNLEVDEAMLTAMPDVLQDAVEAAEAK